MKHLIAIWNDLNLSARIGLAIVAFFAFCAIFAPWLAPYGESEIVGDVWEPFGGEFFLVTDQIGRDLLSRLIFGARNTMALAIVSTMVSFTAGAVLGFIAATLGSRYDLALSRLVAVVISFPTLIVSLHVLSS